MLGGRSGFEARFERGFAADFVSRKMGGRGDDREQGTEKQNSAFSDQLSAPIPPPQSYDGHPRSIALKMRTEGPIRRGEDRLNVQKLAIHEITRDLLPRFVKFRLNLWPDFGQFPGAPLNDSRNFMRPFGRFCETLCDHFAGSRSHKVEHFVRVERPPPGLGKMRPCRRCGPETRTTAGLESGGTRDGVRRFASARARG